MTGEEPCGTKGGREELTLTLGLMEPGILNLIQSPQTAHCPFTAHDVFIATSEKAPAAPVHAHVSSSRPPAPSPFLRPLLTSAFPGRPSWTTVLKMETLPHSSGTSFPFSASLFFQSTLIIKYIKEHAYLDCGLSLLPECKLHDSRFFQFVLFTDMFPVPRRSLVDIC